MSLINRVIYIQTLVDKVARQVKPMVDQYNSIGSIIPDRINELEDRFNKAIDDIVMQANGGKLTPSAEARIAKLNQDKIKSVADYVNYVESTKSEMKSHIAEIAEESVKEVDGVSIEVTAGDTLTIIPKPELFNPVTDFVKNSLTSPETMVVVNTVVTGSSATGGPVVGTGTQPNAYIITS